MSTGKLLTTSLWLMGASAMGAISVAWMFAAEDGKLNAFALVPLMWSVALGSGFVHHLRESGLLQRYSHGSRPLREEPLGVLLPQ